MCGGGDSGERTFGGSWRCGGFRLLVSFVCRMWTLISSTSMSTEYTYMYKYMQNVHVYVHVQYTWNTYMYA